MTGKIRLFDLVREQKRRREKIKKNSIKL